MHWAINGMDNVHVHVTDTINHVVLMNMYTVIAVYCKHDIANMRQKHVHKTINLHNIICLLNKDYSFELM